MPKDFNKARAKSLNSHEDSENRIKSAAEKRKCLNSSAIKMKCNQVTCLNDSFEMPHSKTKLWGAKSFVDKPTVRQSCNYQRRGKSI